MKRKGLHVYSVTNFSIAVFQLRPQKPHLPQVEEDEEDEELQVDER